jgi:riboflavin synthase
MFTGLIQKLGNVTRFQPDGHGGALLSVTEPAWSDALTLGESIAVCGVCLTVVEQRHAEFDFQIGPETLVRTILGQLKPGSPVNLERSLRVGDPIGGHFVTGHVDCTGTILHREQSGEWETVTFGYDLSFHDLLVHKGSVAVDGVSLTLAGVEPGQFRVMLIPHTLAHTTLGTKTVGSAVNLEFDLLAKHVRKLFQSLTITV